MVFAQKRNVSGYYFTMEQKKYAKGCVFDGLVKLTDIGQNMNTEIDEQANI